MRKTSIGLAVMAALVIPLAVAPAAQAAPGDEFIVNGDFSDYDPTTGAITDGVTTTDFSLTTSLNEASFPGTGDMYDPGVYAVSTNPGSLHNQWVEYGGDDPKMVLNGFTEGEQVVWQQTAAGVTCTTPGSTIGFSFTADVANVLPLDQYSDGGANIEVLINGVSIGSADLTSNDGTPVEISDGSVLAADEFVIQVVNHATVYIGNDFSLDNLSLVQTGDCTAPVDITLAYAPLDPTCEADGSFDTSLFPIETDEYIVTVDRAFDGPGEYVITATAKDGFFFSGEGDPFVRTQTVTVGERLTGELCAPPAIGGRTIGFWTNKNGTTAGASLWATVKAEYPVQTAGLNTWADAQKFMKSATSAGDGSAMLRAQFIATALNVQYISGYGAQYILIPVGSPIDGGMCVTVVQYLNDVEAGWASLDTKAERTAVQNVLNGINQDVPLVANQCVV